MHRVVRHALYRGAHLSLMHAARASASIKTARCADIWTVALNKVEPIRHSPSRNRSTIQMAAAGCPTKSVFSGFQNMRNYLMSSAAPSVLIMHRHGGEAHVIRESFRAAFPLIPIQVTHHPYEMWKILDDPDLKPIPQIVLLEYALEGITGIDVLRERERHERWLSIPFILFTPQYDQRMLDACRQAGADNTIPQPRELWSAIVRSEFLRDIITTELSPHDGTSSYRRRPA